MANQVKLTQTVDDRDVVKAWQQNLKLQDRMIRKMDQLGKRGDQAGRRTKGSFAAAASELMRFSTAILGIGGVVQLVQTVTQQIRREIENIRSRQRDAAQTQVEVAKVQREAVLNLGAERAEQLNKAVADIQQDTGSKQLATFRAASTALSFKGAELTDEQAFDAVRVAARISPFDVTGEEITAIAQGVLAQMKQTGGTAEEVAGFQLAGKRQSPVAISQQFSQNIAPGIADLFQFGNTARESMAILAATGQGIGDPTGQITRNAVIAFQKQIAEDVASVRPDLADAGLFKQLEFIRSDEGTKVRQALLGPLERRQAEEVRRGEASGVGLTGEAKAFATLMGFLQRELTPQQKLLNSTLQQLPELDAGDELLNRELQLLNQQTLQQTGLMNQMIAAARENVQLVRTSEGRAHITREGLQQLLKASGSSELSQRLEGLVFEGSTGFGEQAPVDFVVDRLRRRARELTRRETTVSAGTGAPGVVIPRTPTEEEKRTAEALLAVSRNLEILIQEQRDNRPRPVEVVNPPEPPRGRTAPPAKDLSN